MTATDGLSIICFADAAIEEGRWYPVRFFGEIVKL